MSDLWQASFIDTASSPASVLRVKIPGFDGGVGSFAVTWSPLGNVLPVAGDRAFVEEADDGSWVALEWWSSGQATVATTPEAIRYIGAVGQPAFTNSWVNFDNGLATPGGGTQRDVGFYKHTGRVYLVGICKLGTLATSIFTLPVGYRPSPMSDVIFPVVSNGSFGVVQIAVGGTVIASIGSNVYFCLDGISFRHA